MPKFNEIAQRIAKFLQMPQHKTMRKMVKPFADVTEATEVVRPGRFRQYADGLTSVTPEVTRQVAGLAPGQVPKWMKGHKRLTAALGLTGATGGWQGLAPEGYTPTVLAGKLGRKALGDPDVEAMSAAQEMFNRRSGIQRGADQMSREDAVTAEQDKQWKDKLKGVLMPLAVGGLGVSGVAAFVMYKKRQAKIAKLRRSARRGNAQSAQQLLDMGVALRA